MARPTIHVVGLGPFGDDLVTDAARRAIADAPVVRLRTARHPAAAAFADVKSYDDLYESAESFDALYAMIADDLVALATQSTNGAVVYVVPGSPVVAERTVELLLERDDVSVTISPSVSVIDVACARLGRDLMSCGLRVVDALESTDPLRGPGPLLVLQTYSVEVLALLADRLAPATPVAILHHLGAPDEVVIETTASELASFETADHLTSVWVESLRTAGVAIDDLVDLTRTLRRECVWDQEQSHASLVRHLLEEAYEAIDAIERYVDSGSGDASEVIEELGDLLFQIAFHAEIGNEDGRFDLTDVADGVRNKLVGRHPHVFADVIVTDADDAARRWEDLKRVEKGRTSVTDGVPLDLPALSLYATLRRKSSGREDVSALSDDARARATAALAETAGRAVADREGATHATDGCWAELIMAVSDLARVSGVDLELVLRRRAVELRELIRSHELENPSNWGR